MPGFVLKHFKYFGSALRAPGLRSRWFPRHDDLVAISDDGPRGPNWETYATYLTHRVHALALVDKFSEVRRLRGVESRTMKFSKRTTDRVRQRALPDWLASVSSRPGIAVVTCWDRRLADIPEYRAGVHALGERLQVPGQLAERTMRYVTFVPILARLLDGCRHVLWFTDQDEAMVGEAEQFSARALEVALQQSLRRPPRSLVVAHEGEMDDPAERLIASDMVSIPDFIAGIVSNALPHPFATGDLLDVSRPIDQMLREVMTSLPDPEGRWGRGLRIFVVVVSAEPAQGLVRAYPIWFTQEWVDE